MESWSSFGRLARQESSSPPSSHLSPPQFLPFPSLALNLHSFFLFFPPPHHQLLVAAAAVLFISPLSLILFFIVFSFFLFPFVFRFFISLSLPLCQILFQVNTPFSFLKGRFYWSFSLSSCLPPCSRSLHIVRSFLFGIRLSIYAFHAKSLKLLDIFLRIFCRRSDCS